MQKYIDVSADTPDTAGGVRKLPRIGVVLHTTMGTDSLPWLQRYEPNPRLRSSADFLISRVGDIYQVTRPGRFAYHSGPARWRLYVESDGSINQGYLGVELESAEQRGVYVTDAQYIACAALVRRLIVYYRMPVRNVVGHYEVALPLGRKQDPMRFDWGTWSRELVQPSRESGFYVWPEVLP